MIDLSKAKKFYKEYISQYNPKDPKISLKISHIYRVADRAKEIAEELKLSKEDIELAELIGLLHDIGRFEQVKNYNTFIDSDSIDHAEYGVKVLFDNNLIKNFVEDDKYYDIIYKAIINHNKLKIEEGLPEKVLLHSKIIRDADKLDIFYVLITENIETLYGCTNVIDEQITSDIYIEFMKYHLVDYKYMKHGCDLLLAHLAYIFDINFDYTLKKIVENKYIEQLLDRFEFKSDIIETQINNAYNEVNKYIINRLKEE